MGAGDQRSVFCVKSDAKKLHRRCTAIKLKWIINPLFATLVATSILGLTQIDLFTRISIEIILFIWMNFWNKSIKKKQNKYLQEHKRLVETDILNTYDLPPLETVARKKTSGKLQSNRIVKALRFFIVALALFCGGLRSCLVMFQLSAPIFSFIKRTVYLARRDLNKYVAIEIIKAHYAKQ